MRLFGITDGGEKCECHKCILAKKLSVDIPGLGKVALSAAKMILCGECGNKRCPKASDHDLDCTDSNEPGQPGSVYE